MLMSTDRVRPISALCDPNSDREQSKRFIDMAREVEAAETEKEADRAFEKIAKRSRALLRSVSGPPASERRRCAAHPIGRDAHSS
jgi:hypothetical protein